MKIALLSAFYPYRGGIAQFGACLYRALEKNHDLQAFTFTRQYPNKLFPGKTQFVTEADSADEVPATRILDSVGLRSFGNTAKAINETDADVLISQYWMTFFGPSMRGVHKRVNGMKKVTILHNVIPHEKRFFDNWANRRFLKQNDGFVVMSDQVRDDLLSYIPDAKYLRIDHPVYDQFGAKLEREVACGNLALDNSKKYILFFGFIREYKGLDILLESMVDVSEDVHLILAGEAYGSFEPYQQIIVKRNLQDRVHVFEQYISDEEVTHYFSAADACVLPYRNATQSGITAISGHFEVPMITTDVGGLKESIQDGVNGLVVDSPDSKLIAEAISNFYSSDLKDKLSAGMKEWKERHSWSHFAAELTQFVEGL